MNQLYVINIKMSFQCNYFIAALGCVSKYFNDTIHENLSLLQSQVMLASRKAINHGKQLFLMR